MSKVTKRKHVMNEAVWDDYVLPKKNQSIVKVLRTKGNNLHEFCLSFHDEVRYLVSSEYKYETTLAFQVTNLLTRAFCSQRVGINDLPLSVAFFTAVEVEQVLSRESNLSCTTPSKMAMGFQMERL